MQGKVFIKAQWLFYHICKHDADLYSRDQTAADGSQYHVVSMAVSTTASIPHKIITVCSTCYEAGSN